jgi:ABC-2 type transport system permease protein
MESVTVPLALEEAPVASLAYQARVLPLLIARNARRWLSFRVSVVMDLLASIVQAVTFYILGSLVVAPGQNSWQGQYVTFLAVGMVFNTLLEASLRGPYQGLSWDYWYGRLETILLSPCPMVLEMLAHVGWAYVRALVNALLFGLLGLAFGAQFAASPSNLLLAFLALALANLGVLGFGFASAAMFMLINAKGNNDPISWLIGVLQGLVTGVYFPTTLLPAPLAAAALLLPQTYAIDVAHRLLAPNAETPRLPLHGALPPVTVDLLALLFLAMALPIVGGLVFRIGLSKARRDGGLSRWT